MLIDNSITYSARLSHVGQTSLSHLGIPCKSPNLYDNPYKSCPLLEKVEFS